MDLSANITSHSTYVYFPCNQLRFDNSIINLYDYDDDDDELLSQHVCVNISQLNSTQWATTDAGDKNMSMSTSI